MTDLPPIPAGHGVHKPPVHTRATTIRQTIAWVLTGVFAVSWYVSTTNRDPRTGELTSPDLVVPMFVLTVAALTWAIVETRLRRSAGR